MITDAQRKQRFYHLLAHNAKAVVVWNYRSRVAEGQVGDFHMQKWDGSISRRGRGVGDFAAIVQRHANLLSRVYPERVAAVLATEEQQVLSFVQHGPHYIDRHESRLGAYKLLWDMNIPTDCIAENNLDEMDRYKIILLPLVENMSAALAERLKRYVEAGGTLIAEAPFAYKDTDGRLIYHAPGFGLDEVFGGWTADREGCETATPIRCPKGEAKVHFLWHEFTLTGGEAPATYADGTPAVIANRYGKGRAVLAGTEVFRQYAVNPQAAMTALLQDEIRASGAQPTAVVKGAAANVEVSRLSGPGGLLVLIVNHNPHEVDLEIELPDAGPWTDLETGRPRDMAGPLKMAAESVIAVLRPDSQALAAAGR
jgi:beta-galactosidase GanA